MELALTIILILLYWTLVNLLVIDFLQTTRIAQRPDKWYEKVIGWLIGKHPSVKGVAVYFSLSLLAITAFCTSAPIEWSLGLVFVMIISELICIENNHHIGIRILEPDS